LRKVTVIETDWNPLTELWSEVFIVGEEPSQFPALFARARCRQAKELHKADFVLFTGGWADVSPELYGEERHEKTQPDPEADVRDIQVFQEAAYLGIPMVGVCRGAQFLHVMNHGKLYQHVDCHNGKAHDIYLPKTQEYIGPVSSVHHQMCRPNALNGMDVIAVTYESSVKWASPTMSYSGLEKSNEEDIEAFWYPETACLGVQGHPEYMGFDEYTLWFTEMIEEHIILNPDIELAQGQGRRRLKQEVLERRTWRMPDSTFKFLKDHG
jgi:gamma-glutamyl-gamma-aminobutyrate hydrolase PuuD